MFCEHSTGVAREQRLERRVRAHDRVDGERARGLHLFAERAQHLRDVERGAGLAAAAAAAGQARGGRDAATLRLRLLLLRATQRAEERQ